MNKIRRLFFLLLILSVDAAAYAQTEQPARTWIGGGLLLAHSTAENDGGRQVLAGAHLDAAYDLRYGFQARLSGEYRRQPIIKKLFTGDGSVFEATSEIRHAPALVYHFPCEGYARPLIGGGVLTTKHYFEQVREPVSARDYRAIYNGSESPFIIAGAGLGRSSEVAFTYYFKDTYSYSGLRGVGADFTHTRKLTGPLHLRVGVKGKYWVYRKGTASEVSVFVGFHFQ